MVSLKDSGTKVTGLENLNEAESIALAGGSVPVGRYTRQALVNLGTLPETDDPASITTEEVSEALGGADDQRAGQCEQGADRSCGRFL